MSSVAVEEEEQGFQLVQMRVRPRTAAKAARLQDALDSPTRTSAIRMAIEIALIVVDAIREGSKVYVQNGDNRTEIVVPGVS